MHMIKKGQIEKVEPVRCGETALKKRCMRSMWFLQIRTFKKRVSLLQGLRTRREVPSVVGTGVGKGAVKQRVEFIAEIFGVAA